MFNRIACLLLFLGFFAVGYIIHLDLKTYYKEIEVEKMREDLIKDLENRNEELRKKLELKEASKNVS